MIGVLQGFSNVFLADYSPYSVSVSINKQLRYTMLSIRNLDHDILMWYANLNAFPVISGLF